MSGTEFNARHGEEEDVPEELKAEKARVVKDLVGTSKIMNAAEGHDHDSDERVTGLKAALTALEDKILKDRTSKKCKNPDKWDFSASPLTCFNKTRQDLLVAYLRWSVKWEDGAVPPDTDEETQVYNVSKSFRRVEAYVDWMHRNAKAVSEPPMSQEEMKSLYMKSFSFVSEMKGPWESVLWFVDASRFMSKADPTELLRLMCWLLHAFTFDEEIQRRGLVFVEDIGFISFWKLMTLIPMNVKNEIDKLTQGAGAVKLRKFYFMRTPFWMNALMKMASIFINKKMKARMGFYNEDWQRLAVELGAENIPVQFGVGGKAQGCRDRFFAFTYEEFVKHHEENMAKLAEAEKDKQ